MMEDISPYLTKLYDAVLEIVIRERNHVIFTGSLSLVFQKALELEVKDIDCFTFSSYYGNSACTDVNRESSAKFYDSKGKCIEVVKRCTDNGIPVDYIYRDDLPPTIDYQFSHRGYTYTILLATVQSIIEIKQDYINRGGQVERHIQDLKKLLK